MSRVKNLMMVYNLKVLKNNNLLDTLRLKVLRHETAPTERTVQSTPQGPGGPNLHIKRSSITHQVIVRTRAKMAAWTHRRQCKFLGPSTHAYPLLGPVLQLQVSGCCVQRRPPLAPPTPTPPLSLRLSLALPLAPGLAAPAPAPAQAAQADALALARHHVRPLAAIPCAAYAKPQRHRHRHRPRRPRRDPDLRE